MCNHVVSAKCPLIFLIVQFVTCKCMCNASLNFAEALLGLRTLLGFGFLKKRNSVLPDFESS